MASSTLLHLSVLRWGVGCDPEPSHHRISDAVSPGAGVILAAVDHLGRRTWHIAHTDSSKALRRWHAQVTPTAYAALLALRLVNKAIPYRSCPAAGRTMNLLVPRLPTDISLQALRCRMVVRQQYNTHSNVSTTALQPSATCCCNASTTMDTDQCRLNVRVILAFMWVNDVDHHSG